MIKIEYGFRTKGPLHTGADVNAGTLRKLRRQKCTIAEPITYQSRLDDEARRNAVVKIALGVWRAIDKDNFSGPRLMGIWDEFANKLLAAGRASNKYQFLEYLCRSWGIESLIDTATLKMIDAISDYELFDTIRNESIYIVLKMRAVKKGKGWDDENKCLYAIDDLRTDTLEQSIERVIAEDMIPCISGNSFRGKMRRLAMADFCKRVGIARIDKRLYHTLFSGGFLDSSTKYEDFNRMEQYVSMCPMLGVLGSAIGNMTIEGEIKMGWAYPLCRERGTSGKSYWEYLDTVFQTRHDSSKTETDVEITGTKDEPQQMKYEYEVFADGTPFEHRVACSSNDELIVSAFWHMLGLFGESPYIGGMSSVGSGEIIPDWKLGDGSAYTSYIEDHKKDIKEFWEHGTGNNGRDLEQEVIS